MANHDVDGLAGFTIAIIIITTASVALRFWSRAVSPTVYYGWDDWLALAALPPTLAICGLVLTVWKMSLGATSSEISPAEGEFMLKILFAGDILFNISISISKLSALAFYGRVFRVRSNPSKMWRYSFWAVLFLAIAWPIVIIPYTVAQCTPIYKYWEPAVPGHCLGQFDNFMSSAVASVIIDLLILLVPLPQIFLLKMSFKKRLLLAASFFVGYGAAFMSVGRMVATAEINKNVNVNFAFSIVPIMWWIIAECGFSLMAVCLPALFQLGKRVHKFGARSLLSSQEFPEKSRGSYRPFDRSAGQSFAEHRMGSLAQPRPSGSTGPETESQGYHAQMPVGSFDSDIDRIPMPAERLLARNYDGRVEGSVV